MYKAFIIIGGLIILHTLIAKFTSMPSLTDFLPVSLFSDFPKDGKYYQIVPSDKPSQLNLYTYLVGISFIFIGFLLRHFKKRA